MDCLDESSVARFVQGTLDADVRREVERHLDTCSACLDVVSAFARVYGGQVSGHPTLAGESAMMTSARPHAFDEMPKIERGQILGRYLVLERIGIGGMGVVHAAYDPELDRKVALKVMREGSSGSRGRARLQREAQAMAKLSHPNVIAVHDVGAFDRHLFIAMELVDGGTLESWLREQPRTVQEIVEAFRQAGEGLAAAHAVGLVHRDFKPANVLVGRDGRFRVTDFGLARADTEASLEASAEEANPRAPVEGSLTATGAIVGTPAYMSPEQHEGRPADARSDQFSFCVALFEALYGRRPFSGRTYPELAANVLQGNVEPPSSGRVPQRLWPVVRRGLSVDPALRYPDMHALLAALRRSPWRGARPWLLGAVPLGALAIGFLAGLEDPERPCQGASRRVAASWSPERAAALHESLVATDSPLAPSTSERVRERIDAYVEAWVGMYVDACEATHVRGDQSPDLLDRRMRCLDRRLSALDALLEAAADIEAAAVEHMTKAIDDLPPIEGCADVDALLAEVPPPEDPSVAAAVDEVERTLQTISAALALGHESQARARLEGVEARAEATGHAPTIAKTLGLVALAHRLRKDPAELEALLRRGVATAIEGRDDRLAAILSAELAELLVTVPRRTDDAARELELAAAFVRRLGGDPSLEITLLDARSRIAEAESRFEDGMGFAEEALRLTRATYPPEHARVSFALDRLASLQLLAGRVKPAAEAFEQALAIVEANQGPLHPDVAAALNNLAAALQRDGRLSEARALLERSLKIRKTLHGDDAPETLPSRHALAQLLVESVELDAARELLEDALRIARASFGERHPQVAELLATVSSCAYYGGALEEALPLATEVLSIREETVGPDHWRTAVAHFDLAEIHEGLGRLAEAREGYARSLAVFEKTVGPDHPMLAFPLAGLGRVALAERRPADAMRHLERAIALHEAQPIDAGELARARLALARATAMNGDRAAATRAARLALRDLGGAPPLAQRLRPEIEAWLATEGAPK